MWISKQVLNWFEISKEQREELSTLRAENQGLRVQLSTTQANFNWLTSRVNMLEVERAQLLEKAYGVKTIVPEIARRPEIPSNFQSDLFEDMGEKMAKAMGLPYYESQFSNTSS